MGSKFLIALTLLLLGSSIAYSKTISSTITTGSFAEAPVAVLDPSQDSLFSKASIETVFFSAGQSSDTLYVWSVNWDIPSNTSTAIVRKSIDASTLEEKDSAVSINVAIKSKIGIMGQPGVGYVGFAALRDSGKGTADNLFFNVLPADADASTKPTEVKLTSNTATTKSFYISSVFWQDDYFYVLFTQFETKEGMEQGLYLQAIKGSDGTLLWNSAVKVASLDNYPGETMPIAGANKASGADSILVSWKVGESGSVKQTTISISNGQVDDATTLVTDTETAMYYPDGIITASGVYGLVIDKQTETSSGDLADTLMAYYNGATSKPYTLAFTSPKGYNSPMIKSFDNSNGFAVIAQYSGEQDAQYVLRAFNNNGVAQGTQKTLAKTVGSMNFFTDADGAIWMGYCDFSSTDGKVTTGYMGKVLAY